MAHSAVAQRRIVLLLAAACLACAPVPRMGEAVDIAEESTIIIWDEAAKTQHFIRRASFRTSAKDFGFLVPTPSVPELGEADDRAFGHLEKLTAPRVIVRAMSRDVKSAASAPAPASVTVLAQAKVAGYDAVVLEANDATALNNWLKQHDYASTPELVAWFKPYLERKWKISAFKVDRDPQKSNVAESAAVRMSFKSDAPFFPYREPQGTPDNPGKGEPRMLRVYVLADSPVEGTLGASGAWPGRVVWSDRISDKDRDALLAHVKLPQTAAPGALRLSEFEDGSSPRPGRDDVYFRAAANPAVVHRPDEVTYVREASYWDYVPYVVLAVLAGLLLAFLYALWKLARFLIRKVRS